MNNFAKFAVVAAAVVVAAIVGINLLPRAGGIAAPGPTADPTPTPSPSPSTASTFNFAGGDYTAGTTYVVEDPCCVTGRMTFTIPAAGWYAPLEAWRIGKNIPGPGGSDIFDLYVKPNFIDNVYTGGCQWSGTELNPPVGPTVDDLAAALSALPGASPPASVTVGGYPGKKVELSIPEDLDVTTTCDSYGGGSDGIFGWWVDRGYANPYVHGFGQHNTVYIIDVGGTRQVIDAQYLPGASAADRAEQDQIVASIRFESSPSSPSPSP